MGRRIQGFEGRPDLFPGAVNPRIHTSDTNVFYDTLVHDVLSFELLVKRQGVEQIIAGMDDPYPLGEMDTVPGCYPGKSWTRPYHKILLHEQNTMPFG